MVRQCLFLGWAPHQWLWQPHQQDIQPDSESHARGCPAAGDGHMTGHLTSCDACSAADDSVFSNAAQCGGEETSGECVSERERGRGREGGRGRVREGGREGG